MSHAGANYDETAVESRLRDMGQAMSRQARSIWATESSPAESRPYGEPGVSIEGFSNVSLCEAVYELSQRHFSPRSG